MKQRAPRVKKRIKAVLDHGTGIIENISSSGGFLKTDSEIPNAPFNIELKISNFKTIKIQCEPQWENESGVGFKVVNVEDTKEELFNEYVEKQIRALEYFGKERVFQTEVTVTLKDTNVFGNVYFSNYIQYQGVVREKFFLEKVPELHELLTANSLRLVTIDTYNKFINNSYFGDILLVELTTSEIAGASCKLNITFKNKETGELVGEGYQRVCIVGATGRVMRIPAELLDILDFYQEIKE
ncbi:MAG: hypothetical protein GY737_02595 [Desulfobacteraceae bacterium]|nr:hypothetical protein [Desulfobacteraceae bacterium]